VLELDSTSSVGCAEVGCASGSVVDSVVVVGSAVSSNSVDGCGSVVSVDWVFSVVVGVVVGSVIGAESGSRTKVEPDSVDGSAFVESGSAYSGSGSGSGAGAVILKSAAAKFTNPMVVAIPPIVTTPTLGYIKVNPAIAAPFLKLTPVMRNSPSGKVSTGDSIVNLLTVEFGVVLTKNCPALHIKPSQFALGQIQTRVISE